MIRNFDKETSPLTEYEKNVLLPAVADILKNRNGKYKAITSGKMIDYYLQDYLVNPPRLRKVINHIRTKGIVKCLIASSKGYYIAESREEIEAYLEGLKGREDAIRQINRSIKLQTNKLFPKKKRLVAC